jgi:hypothetical protein
MNQNYARQTEALSFRLDIDNLDQLRELAAQRKESLNSLVSRVIDKYLKHWVFEQYGFFSVTTDILRSSLAKLSDEEIQVIGEAQAVKTHKGLIILLYGKVTKETLMKYLELYCSRFASYKHFTEDGKHTLAIFHGLDSLEFSKMYYHVTNGILGLAKIETIDNEKEITPGNFAISFDMLARREI